MAVTETTEPPVWDLAPLFPDAGAARDALAAGVERAQAFAAAAPDLAHATPAAVAAALEELGAIENALRRCGAYAALRRSTDVASDENRDLQAEAERRLVEAEDALRPFWLAWIDLDDERAGALADAPELARDRHRLLAERRYRPHTLSEAEERVLAARTPAAQGAWQTLWQEITSTLTAPFDPGDGERPHTISELLASVHRPDRDVRTRALETLYAALDPHAGTLAHSYDSLVADRLALDRLRGYDDPVLPTHLANELPAEAVDGMLAAVDAQYGIAQEWFRAKAEALGLPRLTLADQYAPLGVQPEVEFGRARELVEEAFARFHPDLAAAVAGFFTESRIDVFPRVGKRGGAFCARVAQDAKPYVLLNYTGQLRDALTLAHELGHGGHFTLANAQTPHSFDTGLALAEVPSTFAEYLAGDMLLAGEDDAAARLGLLAQRVESSFASVFRQVVLARYEQAAYALRGEGRALSRDRLGDIWADANSAFYGDSLELPEGYRLGWSYIPHFISTRFYTYAYAFAELVALLLYARYRAEGRAFADRYVEMLRAGGSAAPGELLAALGVDITDAGVWDDAFAALRESVDAGRAAMRAAA